MAALTTLSIRLPTQVDNTIGTRWRTPGSKPPGSPTLVWGSLSVLAALTAQRTTGTSFSHNVRVYLSGTAAATATISIVQVSGDDASSEGWAISGNNLTHPGSGTGTGFFLLRATTEGTSTDSEVLAWEWAAPVVSDILAPTIPTAIAITPLENALRFDFAQSSDPYISGVSEATGVKDYRIKRGGSVVATVNAASPGISPDWFAQQIGSYSPSPAFGTSSANGGRYSLTSAGTGTHNTQTEQVYRVGREVSGNFKMRAKVVQFSAVGGYQYSTAGIMVGARGQGQPFVYFYQEPSNVAPRAQLKRRATANTNSGNVAAVNITDFAFLEVTRTGDVFRCELSTDNGATWTLLSETTVSMPTTVYWDLAVASQVGGSEVTAIFEQVSLSSVADQSYTLTPALAGNYTISARDVANNESSDSPTYSATPLEAEPTSDHIRFNPGHYALLDNIIRKNNAATVVPQFISDIQGIATWNASNNNVVKGVKVFWQWAAAEGATAGDYNTGLAYFRQLADACRTAGLRLMVSWLHVQFTAYSTPTSAKQYFPDYIVDTYGISPMTNGQIARMWQQPVMDRIIAQCVAYCNADNGHGVAFKDDPVIETMQIDETSIAVTGTEATNTGYSTSAVSAQYKRWISAMRAAAPNMGIRLCANFLGNDNTLADLIAYAATYYCVIGGPDTIPIEGVQANRIFTGTATNTTPPDHDYRGELPFASEVQSPSMNGHEGDWPADELYDFMAEGGTVGGGVFAEPTEPSYVIWNKKEWQQYRPNQDTVANPSGGIRWSNVRTSIPQTPAIRTFIASINGAVPRPGCPSLYPGCITGVW